MAVTGVQSIARKLESDWTHPAMKQIFRVVGSLLVGYLAIVMGAIVGQDLLFGGVSSYEGTPASTLWIAGGLTTLGAAAGGAAMAWISKYHPWISVSLLSAWLAFERIHLARQGILDNPPWFDAVSGGSVIAGVVLGAFLVVSYGKRRAHEVG